RSRQRPRRSQRGNAQAFLGALCELCVQTSHFFRSLAGPTGTLRARGVRARESTGAPLRVGPPLPIRGAPRQRGRRRVRRSRGSTPPPTRFARSSTSETARRTRRDASTGGQTPPRTCCRATRCPCHPL